MRYLVVLGLCLGLASAATATAPLLWRVTTGYTPSSDDLVTGVMLTKTGDLVAQLRVDYGKPTAPAPPETRFLRVRSNGSLQWLSRSSILDPGGMLNEAADGGWYSTSATPSINAANPDVLVRRWTSTGLLVWSRQWDGPLHGPDVPRVTASDSAGNLVIAGESGGFPAVWKYDGGGTLLWTATYPVPGAFTRLEVDAADRTVAAGTLAQATDGYVVSVYTPGGAVAWSDEYQNAAHPRERLTALGLSSDGDVYISGVSSASAKYEVGTNTVRYSPNGDLLWSRRYTDGDLFDLTPTGIASDEDGNSYLSITGTSHPKRTDCVLIKHLPSSEPDWTERRKHSRGLELLHGNVRVDARGYIHVYRMTTRNKANHRFTLSTYQVWGDVVRDAGYRMGNEPLLADLDAQGNTLALANPIRGKKRKHDVVALKVRRFLNSKGH